MKIAACLIVKGSDAEAKVLDRALANIRPYVDGIFVTRTHKAGEPLNHAVGNIAAKYKAQLSDFEWQYDFAVARNFNFAQVPKEYDYIIWMDADDMYRGLEKLRPTIAENPTVDAFGLWYLYEWDEFKKPVVVHRKTMIVKNNDCVRWQGAIHEDLHETRGIDVKMIDGIDRLHLTDEKRIADSKERNLEIARRHSTSGDPRDLWNLGNAYYGLAKYDEATRVFNQFIDESGSDQEKYLAYQRLADIARVTGNHDEAVRCLQLDIGLSPQLPDAYLQLAYQYFVMNNLDKAEQYALQGMIRRPMPNAMIVYNPRDYDYNPMMLLARIYSAKNRPDLMLPLLKGCLKIYPDDESLKQMVKEGEKAKRTLGRALTKFKALEKIKSDDKLRAELDKLPEDLRSHPALAVLRNKRFVKNTSTGHDLVIYCGYTNQKWNPETFAKEGIGGSEEAVVHLAHEWTKLGWNVTVYNNCGHKRVQAEDVTYRPFWEFNPRDKQDVAIFWRHPKPAEYDVNAGKIFIDMHDVLGAGEFTPDRLAKITKVMVKSKAHRVLFPNIPDDKIAIIPNGLEDYATDAKRDPYLILNTSSAERSMDVMPKLFKEIKRQFPRARMAWCYGWDVFKATHADNAKMMKWMDETNEAMEDAGIENLGRLSQNDVGRMYHKAAILAYPTEFYEISCISVLKAQAAGCLPVTTDFAALAESNHFGAKIHSQKTKDTWSRPYQFHFGLEDEAAQKQFVDACVAALKNPKRFDPAEWVVHYEWATIAKEWDKLFG